jgi:hypothetical protein
MKKIMFLIILIIGNKFLVFSFTETWLSTNFIYTNHWDNNSNELISGNGYIGSLGVIINLYQFRNNSNIGLYLNSVLSFPVKMIANINDSKIDIDLRTYDFLMQFGLIIGPGFKYIINNDFNLYYGIGLSYLFNHAHYTRETFYFSNIYNFGIGGDIGIKYNFNKTLYFNIGSIISFEILSFASILISNPFIDEFRFNKNYTIFGIKPYIGFGINIKD